MPPAVPSPGLVAITPASGFVTAGGALVIGFAAGGLCYSATLLRARVKVDDALDVFAVHGVGGAFGAVATGIFATSAIQEAYSGLIDGNAGAGRHPAARRRGHDRLRRRRHVRDHQGRRCDPRDPRPVGPGRGRPRHGRPRRGGLSAVTPGGCRPTHPRGPASALPPCATYQRPVTADSSRRRPVAQPSPETRPWPRPVETDPVAATRSTPSAPLYDARYEHDACGVGFVADAGGRSRDRVLPLALAGLAALGHRGAFGADGESSDGAGVALPLDRSLLALLAGDLAAAQPAIVSVFLPRGRSGRAARSPPGRGRLRRCRPDRRPLAGRAVRCHRPRRGRGRLAPGVRAGDRRPVRSTTAAARPRDDAFERRLVVARRRLETAVREGPRRARGAVRAVGVVPDARLQGPRHGRPAAAALPGPAGAAVGRVHGLPPALRDEHASRSGASPSRSGSSPTTARSTPSAAIASRSAAARGIAARRRSRPSSWRPARCSRRAAPTRSRSTRRSSC